MLVNMSMEEPRSKGISIKPNRGIIPRITDVNHLSRDGVLEILIDIPSTADDAE
jgi:hypothetical protein